MYRRHLCQGKIHGITKTQKHEEKPSFFKTKNESAGSGSMEPAPRENALLMSAYGDLNFTGLGRLGLGKTENQNAVFQLGGYFILRDMF